MIIEAASKVAGLHHKRAFGPYSQVIFMGWDRAAVEEAANQHPSKEASLTEDEKDEEDERENRRQKRHMDYLNSGSQQAEDVSPVGTYIVDSEVFERELPAMAEDLSFDIHRTDTPGVFKADFDFGIIEGVMIICSNKIALEEYCAQADRDDEKGSEEESDDEHGVLAKEYFKLGTKRKSPASQFMTRPKKHKAEPNQPRKYLLKLRYREMGEGEISFQPGNGTITFEDQNFASFEGVADFDVVGGGVSFNARKTSDLPCSSGHEWTEYSERQYDIEADRRWH